MTTYDNLDLDNHCILYKFNRALDIEKHVYISSED